MIAKRLDDDGSWAVYEVGGCQVRIPIHNADPTVAVARWREQKQINRVRVRDLRRARARFDKASQAEHSRHERALDTLRRRYEAEKERADKSAYEADYQSLERLCPRARASGSKR